MRANRPCPRQLTFVLDDGVAFPRVAGNSPEQQVGTHSLLAPHRVLWVNRGGAVQTWDFETRAISLSLLMSCLSHFPYLAFQRCGRQVPQTAAPGRGE